MPTANNPVKMKYCTSSRFSQITKDSDTLYFITDTQEIYLGSVKYSSTGGSGETITISEGKLEVS